MVRAVEATSHLVLVALAFVLWIAGWLVGRFSMRSVLDAPRRPTSFGRVIAEKLRALMGSRAPAVPGADRLLGGLAGLGIVTARLETLLATSAAPDFVEKLANQAAAAAQALQEARALATEAQRDRIAAETAWSEASKIKAELEAANAAHVARSAELDSRAHVTEMREVVVTTRERELEKMLHDVAALKAEYESKLAAIEAIVKGPVSST